VSRQLRSGGLLATEAHVVPRSESLRDAHARKKRKTANYKNYRSEQSHDDHYSPFFEKQLPSKEKKKNMNDATDTNHLSGASCSRTHLHTGRSDFR
jgi:Tfp pilus assembly protein PilO